jgi:hypothetical protein
VPDEKSKNKLPQGSLGLGMPINLGKWYEVLIPNEIQNKLLSSKIYTIMVPVTVTANKYIIVNECSHVSMYITDISKAETHGEFSIPTKKYDRNDCG